MGGFDEKRGRGALGRGGRMEDSPWESGGRRVRDGAFDSCQSKNKQRVHNAVAVLVGGEKIGLRQHIQVEASSYVVQAFQGRSPTTLRLLRWQLLTCFPISRVQDGDQTREKPHKLGESVLDLSGGSKANPIGMLAPAQGSDRPIPALADWAHQIYFADVITACCAEFLLPTLMSTSNSASNIVLSTPELCDLIAPFLLPSIWDLRSAALISRAFLPAVQRILFHDVILNRGTFDVEHVSTMERDDEPGRSLHLAEVIKIRPDGVGSYLRRLRLAFEDDVLRPLHALRPELLPHLREVFLHERVGGPIPHETIALAAHLIGFPTVERVGLVYVIFANATDVVKLFEKRSAKLDALFLFALDVQDAALDRLPSGTTKAVIRRLHLDSGFRRQDHSWLFDVDSPFDLTQVKEFSFGQMVRPHVLKVFELSRGTLRTVTLDAPYIADSDFSQDQTHPDILARLPNLAHVVIHSTPTRLRNVATLLSAIPISNAQLKIVTIAFDPGLMSVPASTESGLQAIADVFAAASGGWADPERLELRVVIPKAMIGKVEELVKRVFELYAEKGRLWIGSQAALPK
uniref:F-box domain-containing protein n=1 Tax=Mycena chlorophos TaxID=658473 RepID=A0ABQ0L1F6_MYCCL|nr:predicted protein [Mycena chlorophos]